MDDNDAGEFLPALRPGRVGAHASGLASILDISRLEARVVLRDDLGFGATAFESRQNRRRGGRPAGERGQFSEEGATVHRAARVLFVEVLDFRAHRWSSQIVVFVFPREHDHGISPPPALSRISAAEATTSGDARDWVIVVG